MVKTTKIQVESRNWALPLYLLGISYLSGAFLKKKSFLRTSLLSPVDFAIISFGIHRTLHPSTLSHEPIPTGDNSSEPITNHIKLERQHGFHTKPE